MELSLLPFMQVIMVFITMPLEHLMDARMYFCKCDDVSDIYALSLLKEHIY